MIDVPLLFETGQADRADVLVVTTVAPEIQRARVLARPGMTEAKLEALLARQMPDAEKRQRAHFLVDSGRGLEAAERQVDAILRALSLLGVTQNNGDRSRAGLASARPNGTRTAHAGNRLRHRNDRPRLPLRRPADRDRLRRAFEPHTDRSDFSRLRQSAPRRSPTRRRWCTG